jgi:hypothetical protein
MSIPPSSADRVNGREWRFYVDIITPRRDDVKSLRASFQPEGGPGGKARTEDKRKSMAPMGIVTFR